jgi:tetratricopeptide (TPR) repeat protein
VPLDWAMTQNNLGIALRTLGERESGTARLDDAVAAYRLALEERTRDRVPLDWAYTRENLGNVLALVAERTRDRGRMAEALACVRDAAEVYREGGVGYTIPSVEKRITELKAALAEMKK